MHGVIIKKDGTTVEINIGEEPTDPVFFVSDLLIHLASEQMEKKGAKVVEGEALEIIVGHKPLIIKPKKGEENKEKKSGAVKDNFLDILKKTYDVEEEDFLSAEIEVVPAGPARECGLDRSLILGYGHDDRVCAYPSMKALINVKSVERTACCFLVDKEEIENFKVEEYQELLESYKDLTASKDKNNKLVYDDKGEKWFKFCGLRRNSIIKWNL